MGRLNCSFPPTAKPGTYRIAVKASKPGAARHAVKRLNVVIGGAGPAPPDVDVGQRSDIERIVDNAMFEMRRNYSIAFMRTSEAIAAGQLKTDDELVKFMNPITRQAREQALTGIDGLLQDNIPRDGVTLKPESIAFFRDIANAFQRGAK